MFSLLFFFSFLTGWSRNPRYTSWSLCRWKGSLVRRSVCGVTGCVYSWEVMNNSDTPFGPGFHPLDVLSHESGQKQVPREHEVVLSLVNSVNIQESITYQLHEYASVYQCLCLRTFLSLICQISLWLYMHSRHTPVVLSGGSVMGG